jgi:polyketide synthase PksN
MTTVEAQTAFQRVLLWGGFEHIIHYPGDLQTMMDRWSQPSDFTLQQTPLDLLNNYSLAGDQLENAISETWKLFFSLPQVGLDDNLFDIGATSLDVIQINAMLRKILKRNIPILEIFNHPTIRSLAGYLRDDKAPPTPTPDKQKTTKERLEKGRSSVQSRRELRQKRKENE